MTSRGLELLWSSTGQHRPPWAVCLTEGSHQQLSTSLTAKGIRTKAAGAKGRKGWQVLRHVLLALAKTSASCAQSTEPLGSLPRRFRVRLLLPYNTAGSKSIWDPHLLLWFPPRAAQRQLWREASSPFPQPEGHLDGKEDVYGFLSWQSWQDSPTQGTALGQTLWPLWQPPSGHCTGTWERQRAGSQTRLPGSPAASWSCHYNQLRLHHSSTPRCQRAKALEKGAGLSPESAASP